MKKEFRVWDKLEERFITSDKGYQGHYVLSLNGEFHNLQNGSGGKEYIVQQYTGLMDKNGRKIFEGDIVERLYDVMCFKTEGGRIFEGCEPSNFSIEKHIFNEVKWVGTGFDFGGVFQIGWRLRNNSIKVVGNIFENYKLLEE
jgi:uncharacterized phage protein (TIGR01671 family)